MTRRSVAQDGTQANRESQEPQFSPDGTKVVFLSSASNLIPGDTNGTDDVLVKDLTTGAVSRISVAEDGTEANGASYRPRFSPDGMSVVFVSDASNLVPSDTNGAADIFVVSGGW